MRILTHPVLDIHSINSDLETLNQWASQWAVSFSPAKSEHMIISKKLNGPNYGLIVLDGTVVNKVSSHSHLGMILTDTLSWEPHVNSRIKKAAPIMNLLLRISRITPRPVKECIYRTCIRPILEYGSMIYDNCPAYVLNKLEKSQRMAALACSGAYRDTSHLSLIGELGANTDQEA